MSKSKFRLTLNKGEARLVSCACEFYTRIRIGQFGEIPWHCCKSHCPTDRNATEAAWLHLRKNIYPDLTGPGHSYGIGKFDDADKTYDVHQVLRYAIGEGREPFSYHTLPECKRVDQNTYLLTMNENETRLVSTACEFYARVRMGQFGEIIFRCADNHHPEDPEAAEQAWLELRNHIYPDLHGVGHSYGKGKFEDADKAFDIHQVLRYCLGDSRKPFSYTKLPLCEQLPSDE